MARDVRPILMAAHLAAFGELHGATHARETA
jgi:hypothetical protein